MVVNIYIRSGAKLPPRELHFDPSDPLHAEFVRALADLRATVYSLPLPPDGALPMEYVAQAVATAQLPVFK